MSRIDNIANFAQRKEEERVAAEIALQQKIEDYKIQIRALKPRIDELIKVGNACLEYNIPLEGSSWGGHEGYDTHQFFTNSWSHLVGFVSNKNRPVTHLGIRAGGACGVWDFYTNGVDIYDAHEKTGEVVPPNIHHMKHFINKFNQFESEFYKYVDSLTK